MQCFPAQDNYCFCSIVEHQPLGCHVAYLKLHALPAVLECHVFDIPQVNLLAQLAVLPSPNKEHLVVIFDAFLLVLKWVAKGLWWHHFGKIN